MHSFPKGNKLGGRPKGSLNKRTIEKLGVDAFFREVLQSAEYRARLRRDLINGDAPQIEQMAYYYAYGKPREYVEGKVVHEFVFIGFMDANDSLRSAPSVQVPDVPEASYRSLTEGHQASPDDLASTQW